MPNTYPLSPLWPAVSGAIDRAAGQFRVEFQLDVPGDVQEARVHADLQLLDQAFFSLAAMACQALGGRPGTVQVSAQLVLVDEVVLDANADKLMGGLPPRGHVHVLISGSMPPAAQDGAEAAGTPVQRMGMAQVRAVLARFNGSMTASIEPDRGFRLEVFLPVTLAGGEPAAGAATSRPGQPHVLFVDDYDAMCELATECLGDAGYRVTCLRDAQEAMALVSAHPSAFDIAVVDFNMPRRSGIDVALHCRNVNPRLPVVIISGYVDAALEMKVMQAGARALVNKAHNLDETVATIGRLLAA